MMEILGGQFLGKKGPGHTTKTLAAPVPSSPSRSRDKGRGVEEVSRMEQMQIARLSTVRESMVLLEHDAMVQLRPQERTLSNASTGAGAEEHSTLYKQHFSGLEVMPYIFSMTYG